MGYSQRNDEIRDNVQRMRREREAYADLGDRRAIQCSAYGQTICVVLADD